MHVVARVSIAALAAGSCAVGSAAGEDSSPEAFYRAALAQMQSIAEPAYVTYRTTVPSGHTSVVVKRDADGYAKVSIRASTEIEPERTWDVAYRGSDGAASIALPDGERALTDLAFFDPTWRGAFRWMRRGIVGVDAAQAPDASPGPQAPASGGTPPPVIAVVQTFGTAAYDVLEGGPVACSDGRPGRHLRLVARTDPATHPLTDVVVDLRTMRFCTMRFHQPVKGGAGKGYFDVDLHFNDVGGSYLITDGRVTGGLRVLLLLAFHLDTAFGYDEVRLPATLPAALFEPHPGPQFTSAPL